MSRIALVTGAGRGIGLELCRQMLESGETVIACPRVAGSEGLVELVAAHPGQLMEIPMDIGDDASIAAATRAIAGQVDRIDWLFNNAGVYPKGHAGLDDLPGADMLRAFEVNSIGPLRVVGHLLPLLRSGDGKRIVNVTSLMGSIADNTSGGSYAYRMSKTALNQGVRNMAHELGSEGFVCLTVHPGWVQTRMGGEAAPMSLEECARQILATTANATAEDNGTFKGPGNCDLPW